MQSLKALLSLFSEGMDPTSRYVLIAITLSCCYCCCFGGSNNSRSSQSISEKGKRQAGSAASKFARLYKLHKHTHTRAHRNAHTHTMGRYGGRDCTSAFLSFSLPRSLVLRGRGFCKPEPSLPLPSFLRRLIKPS